MMRPDVSNSGSVEIDGVSGVNSALNAIPDVVASVANRQLLAWTVDTRKRLITAGRLSSAQSSMVTRSIHAGRTDAAFISVGGSGRLPTGTGTYGDVFWGAEFGGGSRPETRQFRKWRPQGYWFFPTIEADIRVDLVEDAEKALDAAAQKWDE